MSSVLDFSGALAGAGVQLQQTAYNTFGAAVSQFSGQLLGQNNPIGGGVEYNVINGGPMSIAGSPIGSYNTWQPTNYAADLIAYQPKHRFMFRVIFDFDPSYTDLAARSDIFQYVIKHIDRPKITFDYEDVNMYNFHTKVLKTIHHEPLTITLIDDIKDTFQEFYRRYLKAWSPASRTWNKQQSIAQLEASGMNFAEKQTDRSDSAIRGILRDGTFNPLKAIRLIQYFGHAAQQNTFIFVNPRIIDMSFDETHHEGGDPGNHATIRFDYDILHIDQQETSAQRSPYAAVGTDMYGPQSDNSILNTSHDYDAGYQIAGGVNGFGGYSLGSNGGGFSPITNILKGTIGGIVGNAINKVSTNVLSGIANPFLNTVARDVIYKTTNSAQQTATNTLFGNPQTTPYNVINSGGRGMPMVNED